MKTETYLLILATVGVWMLLLGVNLIKGRIEYIKGEQAVHAIKQCEAKLPRNQKCVIVGYEFKIEENE